MRDESRFALLAPARQRELLAEYDAKTDALSVVRQPMFDWYDELLKLPQVETATALAAVTAFLAATEVPVQRLTKSGMRTFDAREPVLRFDVRPDGRDTDAGAATEPPCAILDVVVRHVTPSVRPDDVLAALRSVADLVPPVPSRVTRLAQGPLVADVSAGTAMDAVTDPLAADRV